MNYLDIIQFSGGKDSQAIIHWYQQNENNSDAIIVFCDTGHESKETYKHLQYIKSKIPYSFVILKSKKYNDLFDLAQKKGRFPSSMARFCTTELKVFPFIDFLLEIKTDVRIFQGIRRQESRNRALMNRKDNYFKSYLDDKNKKSLYKKKAVLNWCESKEATVIRPIINWSTKQVFDFITEAGFKRNPLYDKGCFRVGCFPCIMSRKSEIKNLLQTEEGKEVIKKIAAFEKENNTTFFPPSYLPDKFKSKKVINKLGETKKAPTIENVITYIKAKNQTLDLFQSSCKNGFVPCE